MGTHAMIGFWKQSTNEVVASYCHYDGYISGVGKTLTEYYDGYNYAYAVATMGYASALEPTLKETYEAAVHKNEEPIIYASVDVYLKSALRDAEYVYLFDGDTWFVASRYGDKKFVDVETALSENKDYYDSLAQYKDAA